VIQASQPLQIASVADRAYMALRERILAGDLAPDARLHQEDLSRELGVSRTPVREALGRLAAEGLVELLPNRGARVAEVGLADMEAAYQARLIVEPPAAALAAQTASAEDVESMREAIAAHRAHVGEVTVAFTANRAFHLALMAASGNPHLSRFAESLWAGRVGMRVYELQSDTAFIAADADQHEAIADAVEAGDAALAERLTREHVGGAMATFVAHLGAVSETAS
jgi:DNA-binding GntR family transcriptional regulator